MLYSIKNREDLEKLEGLASLQNQLKFIRLQDKLCKQKFHGDLKKVFEPVTKSLESTSQDITETSNKNNQALENLNNKLLEIFKDREILASCLLSLLFKVTNPETSSQFNLVKDSNSNRVNNLLIHKTIPITLYNSLLTFRVTGEEFKLNGDLLKKIAIKNYNVDLASLTDKKMYDFAKELNFDVKGFGRKSTRDRTLIKILKSPSLMVSASRNIIFTI